MGNSMFVVFVVLFALLINGCSFTAQISLIEPESIDLVKPQIYLQSKYFADSTTVQLTAPDCENVDSFFITENITLIPLSVQGGWQTCSTTAGAITYQFTCRHLEIKQFMYGVRMTLDVFLT